MSSFSRIAGSPREPCARSGPRRDGLGEPCLPLASAVLSSASSRGPGPENPQIPVFLWKDLCVNHYHGCGRDAALSPHDRAGRQDQVCRWASGPSNPRRAVPESNADQVPAF